MNVWIKILLGIAAIASCVVHGISYNWFSQSQDLIIHTLIKLWYQDPIEKALLVDIDQDCPQGLKEGRISYHYQGSAICSCLSLLSQKKIDLSKRFLTSQHHKPIYQKPCYSLVCIAGSEKHQEIDPIPSITLNTFFKNDQDKKRKKICLSRIEGYSFAEKAPTTEECNSDEKYCTWEDKDKDYGYCIPSDRECYNVGVQLPLYPIPLQQFPLIGFQVSLNFTEQFDLMDYFSISEQNLLDMNNVSYNLEQKDYLLKDMIFQNQFMPRVQRNCRKSLKEALSNFIGYDIALKFSLTLLILSLFSLFKLIFGCIWDFDLFCTSNNKNSFSYCNSKRISQNNSKMSKICYVLNPIVYVLILIFNIMIVIKYIKMSDEFQYLVDNQCLDSYVGDSIKYEESTKASENKLYNANLTYAAIGINVVLLLIDLKYFFPYCQALIQTDEYSHITKYESRAFTEIQNTNHTEKKLDTEVQHTNIKTSPKNHLPNFTNFQNENKLNDIKKQNKFIKLQQQPFQFETKNSQKLEHNINKDLESLQQQKGSQTTCGSDADIFQQFQEKNSIQQKQNNNQNMGIRQQQQKMYKENNNGDIFNEASNLKLHNTINQRQGTHTILSNPPKKEIQNRKMKEQDVPQPPQAPPPVDESVNSIELIKYDENQSQDPNLN